MKKIMILILAFFLSGCSNNQNIIIPAMTIKSINNVYLKSVSIIDRTQGESILKDSAFGDVQYSLRQKTTPFSKIVSDDITGFIKKSDISEFSLAVQIHQADAYYTVTALQRFPLLGIFALGMDAEYGVYLSLQFEVEQNGKVIRTYAYDNVIKTVGPSASPRDQDEGFQKLITMYRLEFFKQLDREFLARYF